MARNRPDEILGVPGGRLDQLRAQHPAFIAQRLITGPNQEVTRSELANAYALSIGITVQDARGKLRYSVHDIHNLFVLIRAIPGVVEDFEARTFYGIGLI